MTPQSEMVEQLFETSLRIVLHEAFSARSKRYDSGWRVLPFAMIAEFRESAVCCERAGQSDQMIEHGNAVIIPAGLLHRFTYAEGKLTFTRYAHVRFLLSEAIDLLTLLGIPAVVIPPASEQIGGICGLLSVATGGFSLPALVRKKTLEMQLLQAVVNVAPLKPAGQNFLSRVQRMAPVLAHIETHLSEPLGRDELAALVHLSPRYFDAVFKQTMELTPQEYIKRLRIRRAQELLLQSDEPVAAIAARVGYRDPFHFTRQFHAACGLSPRTYRNQVRVSLAEPCS